MPKILPPDFLRERQPLLGSEWEAFLQSYDTPRAYGLRRNPFQDCKTLPFPLEPVPWAADGYYFRPGDRPGLMQRMSAGTIPRTVTISGRGIVPADILFMRPELIISRSPVPCPW